MKELVPALQANLLAHGYETCTPIQQHSVPVLLAKHDVMASAQTGSGMCVYYRAIRIIRAIRVIACQT